MANILVVIVDGSINMARYWNNIRTNILDCIIRRFCASFTPTISDPCHGELYLQLVVFGTTSTYESRPALQLRWATDMGSFMSQLSDIRFTNGGQTGSTLQEGMSAALKMFPIGRKETMAKRQCILITASEASPWNNLVPISSSMTNFAEADRRVPQVLEDTRYLTTMFSKSFISLSVICPKKIQTLQEIYNAGSEFYLFRGISGLEFVHPELLILISDEFPYAWDVFRILREYNCVLLERDSLVALAQNFPPSKEQQKPENSGENNVDKRGYSNFAVTVEMNTWPYEVTGSNFSASSNQNHGTGEFKQGSSPSLKEAVPSQSACSSNHPHQMPNKRSKTEKTEDSAQSAGQKAGSSTDGLSINNATTSKLTSGAEVGLTEGKVT